MKRAIAVLGACLLIAFSVSVASAGNIRGDINTVYQASGSLPFGGSFTINTGGTLLTADAQVNGKVGVSTLSISGPASCSATGGHNLSCIIANPPSGTYTVSISVSPDQTNSGFARIECYGPDDAPC